MFRHHFYSFNYKISTVIRHEEWEVETNKTWSAQTTKKQNQNVVEERQDGAVRVFHGAQLAHLEFKTDKELALMSETNN